MKFVISMLLFVISTALNATNVLRFQKDPVSEIQYLGDVVLIYPDNDDWSHVRFEPSLINQDVLKHQDILNYLKKIKGPFSYIWKGKKNLFVHKTQVTKAEILAIKAKKLLENHLKNQGIKTFHCELLSKVYDLPLTSDQIRFELATKNIAKRMSIRAIHRKHSQTIWFAVKAYRKIWLSKKALKIHTVLNLRDFEYKKSDITGLRDQPMFHIPKNTWTTQHLNLGQVLLKRHVEFQPEIREHSQVQVSILKNRLHISTQAVAQQNGYLGQRIALKNLHSNKSFIAQVVGTNHVEIRL